MSTASATTYQGRPVRILASDPDPSALVWICFVDDPDTGAFVERAELVAA